MKKRRLSVKDCLRPLADGAMQSALLGYSLAMAEGQKHFVKGKRVMDVATEALAKINKIMEEKP